MDIYQHDHTGFCLPPDDKQEKSSSSSHKDDATDDGQGGRCSREGEEEDGHIRLAADRDTVCPKTSRGDGKVAEVSASVSVSDADPRPTITFRLSPELLSERLGDSSASLSDIIKRKGFAFTFHLEMKERTEPSAGGAESDPAPAAASRQRPSGEAPGGGQTREDGPDGGLAPAAQHPPPRLGPTAPDGPEGDTGCPKSWIQQVSGGRRGCAFPMKRCHTFPGMSEALGMTQGELALPYQGCVLSLIINSLPFGAARLANIQQQAIRRSSFGSGRPQPPPRARRWSAGVPQPRQEARICGPLGPRYRHGDPGADGRLGGSGWLCHGPGGEDPGPAALREPVESGEREELACALPQPLAAEAPGTALPAEGEQQQQQQRVQRSPSCPAAEPEAERSQRSAGRCKFRCRRAGVRLKRLTLDACPSLRRRRSAPEAGGRRRLRPLGHQEEALQGEQAAELRRRELRRQRRDGRARFGPAHSRCRWALTSVRPVLPCSVRGLRYCGRAAPGPRPGLLRRDLLLVGVGLPGRRQLGGASRQPQRQNQSRLQSVPVPAEPGRSRRGARAPGRVLAAHPSTLSPQFARGP